MSERYMLFIMERVSDFEGFTAEQQEELDEKHRVFARQIVDAGAQVLASDPLDDPSPASRFAPGVLATDGPFAEAAEIVMGYYTLLVRDEAQARELAALCPTTRYVDLRRILPTA